MSETPDLDAAKELKVNTTARIERIAAEEIDEAVQRLEVLARVMDSAFVLPGTNVRMGLDALIGLVPVIGDLISQAISSYLIWEAKRLGVSRFTLWRMIGNSAVDTVVGFVPFIGDAFDVAFRANTKNMKLLRAHLERTGQLAGAGSGSGSRSRSQTGQNGAGPVIEGSATRID